MIQKQIHQNWRMRRVGDAEWQEAVVPGTVYTDLTRNGRIEDPYFKDNEDRTVGIMEDDFEYETFFDAGEDFLSTDRAVLHFDGLDTIAQVFLNDTLLGDAYNMHRIWEFEVGNILREKDNCLKVVFGSPLKYIREAHETYGNIGNEDTYEGFMHLRKAHYMFGWDWGAHLPDAGIFRPVTLMGIGRARLDSVYIRQKHGDGQAELLFQVEADCGAYTVQITGPDGTEVLTEENAGLTSAGTDFSAVIQDPQFWWPNGLGDQPLYAIKVTLVQDGEVQDVWERKIGLRTMTMRREKDEWGESFAHEVNGVAFFAMGADYIPEEHLIGRNSREKTRDLLEKAVFANFNCIRVWGGGYYPEDWFYDLCDEMGLVVWQDFMFACSVYELTPEFRENIRLEFIDNIKRLRHHASLGLWCGNNEMEMFVDSKCWVTKASEVRDYIIMYEDLIPQVLREYDPENYYWPASPSSGGSFDEPNDPNRGDVHYWEVWHGGVPFSEYRKYFFRYASEFGFQAFPAMKTIEQISDDPKDHNMFSYIMEKHQRNYGANGKIMTYMQQNYLYPTSFPVLTYASQLLQADAIRYGVEHFRRNRGRCMGAVYWQFNDCWPVISWSSVDYCGRLKALHYYAKRFFAPLMLSCEEQGMMSSKADMNRQHFVFEKSIRLNAANETRQDVKVIVRWALRNPRAEVLQSGENCIDLPALSSVWLDKKEFPEADIFNNYISYEMEKDGEIVSESSILFSYPKYFNYEDPCLTCRVEDGEIVVSAAAYAKSVEILNENEDLILSDNYFDMNGGEKRVKVLKGNTDQLRLRCVYDIR